MSARPDALRVRVEAVGPLGANAVVVDALGPLPVRMHPADAALYREAATWAAGLGFTVRPPTVGTTPLSDGEELRVGAVRARCRHLPGHAPGHVVFVFEEAGLVIAGDTLFRGSIGRTDLPYGDATALLAGIRERLLGLPDATRVVPGHGPATTVGEERRTNPFLNGVGGA